MYPILISLGIFANAVAFGVLVNRRTRKSSSILFLLALSVTDGVLLIIQGGSQINSSFILLLLALSVKDGVLLTIQGRSQMIYMETQVICPSGAAVQKR